MKQLYVSFAVLFTALCAAQVTLRVTSIPSNTPDGASIYLAGTMNSWNPGNASYILQPDGLGAYQFTIPEGTGTALYKFTRGSWATVEGNASGGFLPDRSFTFNGAPQTIDLTILSWEDLGATSGSTAAPNVQILSNSFFIPQLNTSRKIWLYLPPDYDSTTKHYPVLYMHDGQNLFDNVTSFSGEWEVDETLNTLFNAGDYGAIVVGIDNGGGARLDEYSPWVNAQYNEGGDGEAYMQFLAETLKPYIDANFRTRPEPQFNALIGSSMGALISMYGACEYPELFEKAGLFSPAFWFAQTELANFIANEATGFSGMRAYFVCGQNESATMVSNMDAIRSSLIAEGVTASETFSLVDPAGTHSESFWRAKFGAAYQWLFADTVLSAPQHTIDTISMRQLANGIVFAKGLDAPIQCTLLNTAGQQVGSLRVENGKNELPELSSGLYLLKPEHGKPLKVFVR
ncbi:alpha/beta hydrolase-fold protein [Flavobacterium caeni]|uniref:Predicted hydrolase of the alpha/beta superfamily n=1 Tax=Flavobacterium caeni TaxID=490189 RepID=A0A1G5JKD4_9FLAO|nr:alpha/beta hydrolase-fold protein [Flavobacterium caeni]SCY88777.1 Predicted hydrolase of the alpha/beta superfamily [Flavobacterium caeni]